MRPMRTRTKTVILTTIGIYFVIAGVGGIVTAGALIEGAVVILVGLALVRWGAAVRSNAS